MRGSVAKKLRKAMYGAMSPRYRKYGRLASGAIVSDERRWNYKQRKKEYTLGLIKVN